MSYSFNPFTGKLDKFLDWKTSADVPDHNSHSVRDTFVHTLNRGKAEAITVTETGGLGISWTAGELYCQSCEEFFKTTAGSGNLTNTAVNYLKWVSGSGLTISTTATNGNEILVATFSVYDGNINGYRCTSLMNETVSNTRRGLRALFPTRVISGLSVHEDTDATNPLDVTMDAGVFWKDAIEEKTPTEVKSRNTAMVRHFHTASIWDSDTNIQIETTNYDNGTQKTAIPANKYVKGLFIRMVEKIGFVYPTEYFNTIAQAQDAALPSMPTGLELLPKLTAIVYQQGAVNFTGAVWQDVRPGISEESFSGITDHGALAGLGDDDHPQYIKDAEFTQNSGILVGTGVGIFAEETGATLRTSIGCAAIAQTMYIGTTSVAINRGTGALTLAGITLTTPDIGTPSAGTLTNCSFPTLNQNTTGSSGSCTGESATVATITTLAPDTATTQATQGNITSLGTLTGLTMSGAIQLGETSIKLDAVLSADAKWSGITTSGTLGATIAFGDLCYLNANDSRWELVDANLSDGYDKQLGICLDAGNDGDTTEMLVFGKVRAAAFPAFTVGSQLYMSETAGDLTHTVPTTADCCVRAVGVAISAEDLLFQPSNDYLIHV